MKERFIKSTVILLIGGLITKILGMIIKIIMSRILGPMGLGVYMMILPTFSLFIGISQFGLPIALSKLVAEDNKNNRNLFFSIVPIALIINIILIILIFLIAPVLANTLLHNKDTYLGIISISFVIPFTCISSICRSYFFGKERMVPHVISNIIEDIIRLIITLLFLPYFIKLGIKYAVCFMVLSNVISEIASILILIFFLPKGISFNIKDFKFNKNYMQEVLSIGLFNTTGRFIGSVGYFLEPIILTSMLLLVGYSSKYITFEYGVITGYVLPLLLLPSFFTISISQALLPVVSKEFSLGHYRSCRKKIISAITISLIIGVFCTVIFILIPGTLLKIIYHTNKGITYMRVLAPICLLQYIQSPLSSSLDAMGKSKIVMKSSILGVITRTFLLCFLSFLKIGIYSLIISIGVNILVITIYQLKKTFSYI